MASRLLLLGLLLTLVSLVSADHSPMRDFCVADFNSSVVVNAGFPCKNFSLVETDDFFTSSLDNTASVFTIPGLNTLGLTMLRIDLAPTEFIDPHHHPRATEIHVLLEGRVEVGFISGGRLFKKVLEKGNVFVFPQGLIHFQRNIGKTNSSGISCFNSQSSGSTFPAFALFGSDPVLSDDFLAKAFQTDKHTINKIASNFRAAN